jgi:hypothetical protein
MVDSIKHSIVPDYGFRDQGERVYSTLFCCFSETNTLIYGTMVLAKQIKSFIAQVLKK